MVDQNANAILHVSVENRECPESVTYFITLPWFFTAKLDLLFFC